VTATVEVLPPETESQIAQSALSADSGVMETFGSAVAPIAHERKILRHAMFGDLRILDYKGETWYVANEVAKALKYENPHKAILDHCKGANETLVPSSGGEQRTKIINNADVFDYYRKIRLDFGQATAFSTMLTSISGKSGMAMMGLSFAGILSGSSWASRNALRKVSISISEKTASMDGFPLRRSFM